MSELSAFPLHWPAWIPRTKKPAYSQFNVTPGRARSELLAELRRIGASHVIISSNIKLRQDGLPYVSRRPPDDTAIAVYFTRKGVEQCIACDRYRSTWENMRAIGKTIEALRGLERWGTSQMVDAAFRGFAALPETTSAVSWWDVLDVGPDAGTDDIERSYRILVKLHHPDVGGNLETFHQIQAAYRQAKGKEQL